MTSPSSEEDARARRRKRLAAGALLLAGDRAANALADAARAEASRAAVELGSTAGRADHLRSLVASGARMSALFAAVLVTARREAREAASGRLAHELRDAGQDGAARAARAVELSPARLEADVLEARVVADSLASQWRAAASHAARAAARRGQSPGAAVSRTVRALGPKIRRAAGTETARAYGDEHAARLRDLVASGDIEVGAVMREWSALLDACEECWPHDGERVGIDEEFAGGAEPGGMHVNCRCMEHVVSA